MIDTNRHNPVMLREMLAAVDPKEGEVVVDGTFGAGGYSKALLQARARVIAFDRDPNAKLLADALARESAPGHFLFLASRFGAMLEVLAENGITQVDAVVLDVGVSSMQIDDAHRGFSFSKEAPLDMRMSQQGVSAADVVNHYGEVELTRILRDYGEEREAKRIARAIVASRGQAAIETTTQLADIVRGAVRGGGKIHPATRTFQALRIEVNQELAELEAALVAAEHLLKPGGRLVVVSFHSLEDRIVKQFMASRSGAQSISRHSPAALLQEVATQSTFKLATKSAITPSEEEVKANPRARSAKLRCAIRTSERISHAA